LISIELRLTEPRSFFQIRGIEFSSGIVSSTRQMTVLIVRDRESAGGGIFNYYNAIAKHLTSRVHFIGVGKPHSFYGDQGPALFRFTGVRLLWDWLTLFVKIIRFRPDLVHVNPGLDVKTFRSLRRDAVNILIARLFRRRVLVFWRGWDNSWCGNPEFPAGNNGILCRIYKMAAAHIVLSERFKKDLLRWGFETPIHVETTVVADDCLAGSATPPQPGKARTDLLYLSRVEVAKGIFELLDAYKILKARNPAYTLTIGGDGPDLEELKAYAKKLELSDVVFTGFLQGEAKVNCYRQGSVFCFLSYTEGMPNAVLEALAMGLPIVSSDAGGLGDILRDSENGFIVPPLKDPVPRKMFDPMAVANAIERLTLPLELHERISTINWRYARQRFAAPVVAKRLEAIYRGLSSQESVRSGARSEPVRPIL
jgi:glycosyltransferase involved in cell wall biosynthesis